MASVNKRASQRMRDSARAAALKAAGVVRTVLRCPVCYAITALDRFPEHIRAACRREENPR
jgi:hypothetical protein